MVNEGVWKAMAGHLGYDDEEARLFRENPRNEDVMAKGMELMGKTIVIEVTESMGCNTHHKVGDKFYFDGAGNLLTKMGPSRICIYALSAMQGLIFASNELFYAGVDPNELRFNKAGCFDVGVKCGGWGHINVKLSMIDRDQVGK